LTPFSNNLFRQSLLGKRAAAAYAGTALAVGALVYALGQSPAVSFTAVSAAIGNFPWSTLVAVFGLWSVQTLAAAIRLHVLLEPKARPSFWVSWQAFSLGQWLNAFLPARAGDALKLFLVNRQHPHHGFSIAGTLAADRMVDLAALALVVIAAGVHRAVPVGHLRAKVATGAAIALAVGLLGIVLFKFLPEERRRKVRHAMTQLAQGFQRLRRPFPFSVALLVSIVGWFGESSALVALARSQGFPLSIAEGVYLLLLLNAATAIPVSVGQVGPFEAAIVYALGTLGVPTVPALAVAVTHHLFYFGTLLFWAIATSLVVRGRHKGAAPSRIESVSNVDGGTA
jgi:uncharacterized membrane protein YbhN (UPF0104 family)